MTPTEMVQAIQNADHRRAAREERERLLSAVTYSAEDIDRLRDIDNNELTLTVLSNNLATVEKLRAEIIAANTRTAMLVDLTCALQRDLDALAEALQELQKARQ